MFVPTSRYTPIETAVYELPDGRVVRYKRRRFVPAANSALVAGTVRVTEGDRLDHLATRALGDPELFWRIADANEALHPRSLTSHPGRLLRIPAPRF